MQQQQGVEKERETLNVSLGVALRLLAAVFFAEAFLAEAFLAEAFLAGAFLAGAFLAGAFLAWVADLDFLVLALVGMDRHIAVRPGRAQDCCRREAEREVCFSA